MAEVIVHATGQTLTADGPLLDYYRGEAATVGGYTIDGAEYPRKIALSDFDPGDHTVDEVQEHLALSMPGEQARVLDAERAGQARVTLLREYELPDTASVMAEGTQRLAELNDALGGAAAGSADLADSTAALTEAVDPDSDDDHPSPRPH